MGRRRLGIWQHVRLRLTRAIGSMFGRARRRCLDEIREGSFAGSLVTVGWG